MQITYFLFGSEAVDHLENYSDTFSDFLEWAKENPSGYAIYCFSEGGNPIDLIMAFEGWGKYMVITEKEYEQIDNL